VRLKGQETSIIVTSATNGVEPAFTDVKSFEVTFKREIFSEQYVGQTSDKHDDIFNGVTFTVEFHSATADVLSLYQRLNEVSKRRLPGEVITVVTTLRFPEGGSRRIALSPCYFGDLPVGVGSRKDFVSFKLDGAADDGTIIAAP
jgi:hypothetical protein